jgi:hypothetical protein
MDPEFVYRTQIIAELIRKGIVREEHDVTKVEELKPIL